MTFKQAKNKLDNMTDEQFDIYGQKLATLHKKIVKIDEVTADALELALFAMGLYCNK